ncbi:hypothetical protein [Halopseudomonas bauzanensis]|uniref:Uncharacterized protein n=1 Tax=Halopseudomonas bauzanensis TaxID=653930 RepID=A0A1H9WTC0_9GAMM|nr:hypothetical protein [Halopseudomonas bauzanensis]SES37115.1 hypothetical protein SAMN05216589_0076 [Halopseudomonas bauzanensis]SFM39351.1 hypothetical protein SAMN04487855_0075 [Halopseudomonas bauzanensis]
MRNLLALVLLTAFPYSGFAATTTCILEGGSITVKAVAWDDETNVAKVTDHLGNTREGRVTLESDHNHGKKVNIFVDYESASYGVDAAEYIVFPTSPGTYRIIGVAYIVRDGEQFLNSSHGNHAANCVAM